jgi:pimeloyl-ACP methyl ester carboxylesterase
MILKYYNLIVCIVIYIFAYHDVYGQTSTPALQTDTLFDITGSIPPDAKEIDFYGYCGYEFSFRDRKATVIVPHVTATNHPWLWRSRFMSEPQTDIALLKLGFHVVRCDVSELFGNAEAISVWDAFYRFLRTAGLSSKAVMTGFSRGGVYAYRWAATYPDRVAAIYADAPVLDLKSWPGGLGKGKRDDSTWETFKKDFGLLSDEQAMAFNGNPLDLTEKIARAGFPMLHVVGDDDQVVPVDENTAPFEKKIREAGGDIRVIHKPGVGHHPHSLKDPAPIVDFILRAIGYQPVSIQK